MGRQAGPGSEEKHRCLSRVKGSGFNAFQPAGGGLPLLPGPAKGVNPPAESRIFFEEFGPRDRVQAR